MSDAAKWYVVHTYSGYENKGSLFDRKSGRNRKLHDLIQAVNIPTEKVVEVKGRQKPRGRAQAVPGLRAR